jgi:hypothetical protein
MSTIVLPETDNQVVTLGIIAALEMEAARELSEFLDNHFKSVGQPEWFEDIKYFRQSIGQTFSYKSPRDLRFLLAEATDAESQIWHLIPGVSQAWVNAAHSLKLKLNQFHHQQLSPDLNTLLGLAMLFDLVATPPGLQVSNWARALISRIKSILSGSYVPKEQGPLVAPEATAVLEEKYKEVIEARAKRPPLGSRWMGERPERHLTLDRQTRDIYDKDGISVKLEIEENATEAIDKWLWYFPLGGDIFVAEDGAVMGYIKGDKYMIGWLGPEPEDYASDVRGYVLPNDYLFTGEDIEEVGTGLKLRSVSRDDCDGLISNLKSKLPERCSVSISDYGDLFVPMEEGEPERLATAHRGIWFPGHLPGDATG